tara:strand:- start:1223 stop:1471 length:249 start_codon:yes stop_codon:yes gene_type:complete
VHSGDRCALIFKGKTMDIELTKHDGLPCKTNLAVLSRHVIHAILKDPFIEVNNKDQEFFEKAMRNVMYEAIDNLIGEKDGTS